MSCTLPQVFMLNYAAYREAENAKRKADYKRDREEGIVDEQDPYLPEYGMKLSELKNDPVKFGIYLKQWSF